MKRQLPLPIFVIALVIMLVIASTEYVYLNDKVNQADSGIHITGNIKIIQNGLIVRNIPDAIQSEGGVDVIMCKVWNYTEACSNPNTNYGSSTNQYTNTDDNTANLKVVYYRLKENESDGSFTYSSIIKITIGGKTSFKVITGPNPFINKRMTDIFN